MHAQMSRKLLKPAETEPEGGRAGMDPIFLLHEKSNQCYLRAFFRRHRPRNLLERINIMPVSLKIRTAVKAYDLIWTVAAPLLRRNARLKDGFARRRDPGHLPEADIWIQAASAGEAYLALSLLEDLNPEPPTRVLVTTNTRQGLDILNAGIENRKNSRLTAWCAFAPFDRPKTMAAAMARVRPGLLVLLETELWPGLLFAAKSAGVPVALINGRLTEKSLRRYRVWPALWNALGPDRVLAISPADAGRFAALFGQNRVGIMSNIKFDRLKTDADEGENALSDRIPANSPFLVLGSVREPEEADVSRIIARVLETAPETVIGLFPRHMHRIPAWESILSRMAVPWMRRSALAPGPVPKGQVILWDAFGELSAAYGLARAVFVGGSLAPLGGQNFLEPMIRGLIPVIGPSWENFAWAGPEIFDRGLAVRADDWRGVAAHLLQELAGGGPSSDRKAAAVSYLTARQGGARKSCRLMETFLRSTTPLPKEPS